MSENSERQSGDLILTGQPVDDPKDVLPPSAIQVLADEVVVRLASLWRAGPPRLVVGVEAMVDALISSDVGAALRIVDQERADGVSVDEICLHTLAGAARQLGDMWDEDKVSFLTLTVAIGRIFEIMRRLRQEVPLLSPDPNRKRRAFFASVPGDTHTLGVTMGATILRNHGWDISLRTGLGHDSLIEDVLADDHELIGLSAGDQEQLPALMRLIVALHLERPHAKVLVCGAITGQVRGLADMVHADGVIPSDEDAVAVMERFLDQRAPERG